MCHGACQLYMTHSLPTYLGQRDFNTTLLADNSSMFKSLVLATKAFVILIRAKDLGTEQAISFRFEGSIIDCFGLFDLTV